MGARIDYRVPGSLRPFLLSERFITLTVGPYGCVSADTEVLTPDGWVPISRWNGQKVMQWDPETGAGSFVDVEQYHVYPADCLIEFRRRSLVMKLSFEHRMPLYDYADRFVVRTAARVFEKPSVYRVPVSFRVEAEGLSLSDDELRLWVVLQADGHFPARSERALVTVRKQRKKERLRQLLSRMGIEWTETVYEGRNGETRFSFARPDFLASGKLFDSRILRATPEQLSVMLDEIPYWDGCRGHGNEIQFFTSLKSQADLVQYMAHACGRRAYIGVVKYENGRWRDTYRVHITREDSHRNRCKIAGDCIDRRIIPTEDGFKYCVTVPSGFFVARCEDTVFITGNSGKTTAGLMKIIYHASRMAPCRDGVRRSRAIWVRQTIEQLKDTSIKDFLKWFPDGVWGSYAKSERVFYLRFADVECEVLFRSLDDANDVRRLLSLQASFAILDEFREIHPDIYHAIQGRLGRYPDKSMNGLGCVVDQPAERCQHCWTLLDPDEVKRALEADRPSLVCGNCGRRTSARLSNAKLWGMTNPPDEGTFWGDLLTNPPDNVEVVWQPSGMSPEADWLQYLPEGYYEQLAQGKEPEWVDVYVHAKLGKGLFGRPVHRHFSRELHVAEFERVPGVPLVIGADAGLRPACLVAQITPEGRLLIHDELYDECAAYQFVHNRLIPLLRERYRHVPVQAVIIDPAAFQRAQTDERTVAQVYQQAGFRIQPGRTNALSERIAALDDLLTRRLRDDRPGILIHPRCTRLIEALSSRYAYKKLANGTTRPVPEKNHPWSDLCFVAGTPVLTPRGYVPIETLQVGDEVVTHEGVRRVVATGSRRVEQTLRLRLSSGDVLQCTVDHPFIKVDGEVVPAYLLHEGDELEAVWQKHWSDERVRTAVRSLTHRRGAFGRVKDDIVVFPARVKGVASRVLRSMGCGSVVTLAPATITTSGEISARYLSTDTCIRSITERFLKGIVFTIRIIRKTTTPLTILRVFRSGNMPNTICLSAWKVVSLISRRRSSWRGKGPRLGIVPRKGGNGTVSTPRRSLRNDTHLRKRKRWYAYGAGRPIWAFLTCVRKGFAHLTAKLRRGVPVASMTRTSLVSSVVRHFVSIDTPKQRPVLKVVELSYGGAAEVYNLTVEGAHTYYAGPALVHNCDSLHYLAMDVRLPGSYNVFGARGFGDEPVRVMPAPVRVF